MPAMTVTARLRLADPAVGSGDRQETDGNERRAENEADDAKDESHAASLLSDAR
jgi:hypothetical protein